MAPLHSGDKKTPSWLGLSTILGTIQNCTQRAKAAHRPHVSDCVLGLNGAPGEIRTPDLLIRSQSLYPAELRAHLKGSSLQNLNQINRVRALVQCTRFCATVQAYAGGAVCASVTGEINGSSSATSSPLIRISLVTDAGVRRVASNSTRTMRTAGSRLILRMPYTSRMPASAKATDSLGGAV
jgi:hypothetical protein